MKQGRESCGDIRADREIGDREMGR